jgi:hypothetical protein
MTLRTISPDMDRRAANSAEDSKTMPATAQEVSGDTRRTAVDREALPGLLFGIFTLLLAVVGVVILLTTTVRTAVPVSS